VKIFNWDNVKKNDEGKFFEEENNLAKQVV